MSRLRKVATQENLNKKAFDASLLNLFDANTLQTMINQGTQAFDSVMGFINQYGDDALEFVDKIEDIKMCVEYIKGLLAKAPEIQEDIQIAQDVQQNNPEYIRSIPNPGVFAKRR